MGTYYIGTSENVVNGNTFCGGSPCTAADIIIIDGGPRGNLSLQNFNGSGSYIPILNENASPDERVVITSGSTGEGYAPMELRSCKYVDLRGNNDADLLYGTKIISDGVPVTAATIWVRGESDHIKISYIEMAFDGNTTGSGNGVFIQDATLSNAWIWDTIEIHHNYIHDTRYAGMYLGQNYPLENDNPYLANVSVHDNIMEDIGSYGMTLKGIHSTSGVCSIYNNVIRPSDRSSTGGNSTGLVYAATVGEKRNGIKNHYYYGSTYANIYNNWIEKTEGAGLVIGDGNHQIYDNTIVGCGTGNNSAYGHAIRLIESNNTSDIYDNIIIQPTRYGIYNAYGTGTKHADRNLIGDPGVGYIESDPLIVEGTGEDANIKHADVADFGFTAWSDDGDYSNDIFTFGGTPYTRSRGILRQKPRYNVPGGRFR